MNKSNMISMFVGVAIGLLVYMTFGRQKEIVEHPTKEASEEKNEKNNSDKVETSLDQYDLGSGSSASTNNDVSDRDKVMKEGQIRKEHNSGKFLVVKKKSPEAEKKSKELGKRYQETRDKETLEQLSMEIDHGMTKEEVLSILGQPDVMMLRGVLSYSSDAEGNEESQLLNVSFLDEKGKETEFVQKIGYGSVRDFWKAMK